MKAVSTSQPQLFKPGRTAWIGNTRVRIVRQVLFRIPAFRVLGMKKHKDGTWFDTNESWVCEGKLVSSRRNREMPAMLQIPEGY